MLDINLIREKPDLVRTALKNRQMDSSPVDDILRLDEKRRVLLTEVEKFKAERNTVSKEISKMKDAAERETKIAAREVGDKIAALDKEVADVEAELTSLTSALPNIPDERTPLGVSEDDNIVQAVPARRQTMLFSATFPPEVESLASQSLTDPQRISMGISRPVHTVTHALYPVPSHLKTALLLKLLRQIDTDSVLVFTRTKHRADKVARQIAHAGFRVTSLHSNRSQGQREQALRGFKSGHFRIMVATDIAARGLDIEGISHVINYDRPDTADAYIHRFGRTGRAQRTGDASTLVTPDDNDMIRTLERIMGHPLKRETLPDFDYAVPAPPRHGHAMH